MIERIKRKLCKIITKMDRDKSYICITKEDADKLRDIMDKYDITFELAKDNTNIKIYTNL